MRPNLRCATSISFARLRGAIKYNRRRCRCPAVFNAPVVNGTTPKDGGAALIADSIPWRRRVAEPRVRENPRGGAKDAAGAVRATRGSGASSAIRARNLRHRRRRALQPKVSSRTARRGNGNADAAGSRQALQPPPRRVIKRSRRLSSRRPKGSRTQRGNLRAVPAPRRSAAVRAAAVAAENLSALILPLRGTIRATDPQRQSGL